MPREIDKRNHEFTAPLARTAGATVPFAMFLSKEGAGEAAQPAPLDPFTGSVRRVEADNIRWEGSPRLVALTIARAASEAMSAFSESQHADFALPTDVQATGAGTNVIHVPQVHMGLPVFQAGRTVQLRSSGKVLVTGTAVEMLQDAESEVRLDVVRAVELAAAHVASQDADDVRETGFPDRVSSSLLDLSSFSPKAIEQFDLPMQPTILEAEPFDGPIKAHLLYFYQGPEMRLSWHVELVFPDRSADYEVVVAAGDDDPGEILYAHNRVCNLLGRCEVYAHNPGETPRGEQALPPAPAGLPTTLRAWPRNVQWLSRAETTGNSVASTDQDGAPLHGSHANGTVHFTPSGDIEEAVLNTFYFCNVMHDFFYALGFDEASGNFQTVNRGGEPGANDAVRAWVFGHEVDGVASMLTPPDGTAPTMRMGKYGSRHTGFDSDVVFHEFVHGVTNRLVGRRLDAGALSQPQSRGMGEGWSDYFALTYQNVSRVTDKNVTGDWVTARSTGIRGFPYDDAFPDGFGNLSTGRYANSVHARGEIWCASLMKATRNLAAALNDKERGYAIAWQAVLDGLKLAPSNPSFLDARDAILTAIDDIEEAGQITAAEATASRRAFWRAFASSGMGVNAATRGATLLGIVADNQVPSGI